MNLDILEGKWDQIRGKALQEWGKLTDDDLDVVEGNTTELSGLIQERYGITKEEAEDEIRQWSQNLS